MDVLVTVEVSKQWLRHRFEPVIPAPVVADIVAAHKNHTLHVVTDQPAREKVKSAKGLTTDLEVMNAVKEGVLEAAEFVRWL
jgi:hypothetical protein